MNQNIEAAMRSREAPPKEIVKDTDNTLVSRKERCDEGNNLESTVQICDRQETDIRGTQVMKGIKEENTLPVRANLKYPKDDTGRL